MKKSSKKAKQLAKGCRKMARQLQEKRFPLHKLYRGKALNEKGKPCCAFGYAAERGGKNLLWGLGRFKQKAVVGRGKEPTYLENYVLFEKIVNKPATPELEELLYDLQVYNDTFSGQKRRQYCIDSLTKIAEVIERDYV